jgi:hypothetical protein
MAIRAEHELHARRRSRNIGVALTLAAFIAVMFGLTVAKIDSGGSLEAFDHTVRPSITVDD